MYLSLLTLVSILVPSLLAKPMESNPSKPPSPPRVPNLPSEPAHPEVYSECLCFQQRYSHRPLRTVYFTDCDAALQQIQTADKVSAPMMFSRTGGYTVPHPINVGSCSILLDINDKTQDKTVTLPMIVVVSAIRLILARCVSNGAPPGMGLGGFTEIHSPDGSGGILDVVLVGRFSPAEDPPPFAPGSMSRVLYKPSR